MRKSVQNGGIPFTVRAVRGPIFSLRTFKNLWAFVYDCIYYITITYHYVENLVWFAIWDYEYWYALTHLDFRPEDQKPH